MYLTSPLSLNDPFDCRAFLDVGGRTADRRDLIKRIGFKAPVSERRVRQPGGIDALIVRERPGIAESNARKDFEHLLAGLGIFCMTEDSENLLMWSHYADQHRGVCIEFAIEDDDTLSRAQMVTYSETYPVIRGASDAPKALLMKSPAWAYEREWRCVEDCTGKSRLRPMSPNALKSVTIGAAMSETGILRVVNACHDHHPPVRVRQARRNPRFYKLDFLDRG